MSKQPEALRLADELEMWTQGEPGSVELRRQHAEIERLTAEQNTCGSGAWCLHKEAMIDSLTAERDIAAGAAPVPDSELPGMWESADFLGGAADMSRRAAPVPEGWRSAVAMAYGHLWHINNEPMAPIPLRSEESASYAARKLLRDLLTTEERGEAINAVQQLLAAAPKEPT